MLSTESCLLWVGHRSHLLPSGIFTRNRFPLPWVFEIKNNQLGVRESYKVRAIDSRRHYFLTVRQRYHLRDPSLLSFKGNCKLLSTTHTLKLKLSFNSQRKLSGGFHYSDQGRLSKYPVCAYHYGHWSVNECESCLLVSKDLTRFFPNGIGIISKSVELRGTLYQL